jgi:putative drug exporter of the RND superfamily
VPNDDRFCGYTASKKSRITLPPEDPPKRGFDLGFILGRFVARFWPFIILFWILLAISARLFAPSWDSLAYDGDFEYLPDTMPSVAGARLLDEAFPKDRARSQILILISRSEASDSSPSPKQTIAKADEIVGLDLTRQLYHKYAESSINRAIRLGWQIDQAPKEPAHQALVQQAMVALDEAIIADEVYYEYFSDRFVEVQDETSDSNQDWPRMAIAYWDRAALHRALGNMEQAEKDALSAIQLFPGIKDVDSIASRKIEGWESLLDVLTWNDPVIGHRLSPKRARLVVLRLSSELAAVSNIATLNRIEALTESVLRRNASFVDPGLRMVPTGTAAIGGETLRASADAIRYTEILTVVLILFILAVIYRSPLLVAVPLISIVIAVICATGLVSVIASASNVPGLEWVDLKIFTTSRIFVVVILFGAGTDYCLFLIARLREEASQHPWPKAVELSLARVSKALVGSALTTVVGLAMLWVADFGKFHYSGPVIAICLLVALAVCTTLTPAILMGLGPLVLWPGKVPKQLSETKSSFWHFVAGLMTRRPIIVLCVGLGLLIPPSIYGFLQEGRVTYDISSELGPSAVSRQGVELLRENLSLGESNPITLLFVRREPADREQLEKDARELSVGLYGIKGVAAVRHATDPLGDYPPGTRTGLFDRDAWRRRAMQSHRISQRYFWSDIDEYKNRLVRLDVISTSDPFQKNSADELKAIQAFVTRITTSPDSIWSDTQFAIVGTVPSITDLRQVTRADAVRIKVWVVLAVFLVLILVLWRVGLSLYMIVTVLLSYYATLGVTAIFFRFLYGDTYTGLDWKVPIFLFVILVAVGQDYNVYLVTRILEERKNSHPLAAVRRAVARTGGIITSCGLVMAGTFFSMTASAWVPGLLDAMGIHGAEATGTLRGITELGFALGFGVLLDTFYIRTVLVPAFCVLGSRPADTLDPTSLPPV